MTLREKLEIEHPECIDENQNGGCKDCPSTYGYPAEDLCDCKTCTDELCRKCWDRKYEGELTPQEKKIEELREQLICTETHKEFIRMKWSDSRKRLSNLRQYVRDKTGLYCLHFHDDEYIKDVFDETIRKRNWWRSALIGTWIGWFILFILTTVFGG